MNKLWIIGLVFLLMSSFSFASIPPNASATELYYSFDNNDLSGSNPLDLTPNNNDGTNNGATTGATGIYEQAFEFDGANDDVDLGTGLNSVNNQITVNFWFNADNMASEVLLAKRDSTYSYELGIVSDGRVYFGVNDNGQRAFSPTSSYNSGQWYMLTGTYNGATVRTYLNGVEVGTYDWVGTIPTSSDIVYIGKRGLLGFEGYYDGSIDEVAIFNEALNQSQIDYLYASGAPTELQQYPFVSPSNANFTITATDEWNGSNLKNINATIRQTLDSNFTMGSGSFTESTDTGVFFTTENVDITGSGSLLIYETGNTLNRIAYTEGDLLNNTYYENTTLDTNGNGISYSCTTGVGVGTCNVQMSDFGIIDSTYTNTTGNTITTNILSNSKNLYNLTLSSTDYFSKRYTNVNVSSNLNVELYQSEIRFNATQIFTNFPIEANFTITAPNGTNITKPTDEAFRLSQNNYTVYFSATDYYSESQTFEVLALENTTKTYTNVSNSNLTITATNLFDDTSVQNFSFTLTNENVKLSYDATNGSQVIFPFIAGTYNITANATGFFNYNDTNFNVSTGNSTYDIDFQQVGALAFYIRDLDTGNLINTSNTTVIFSNSTAQLQFNTSTGIGGIEGLSVASSYDVVIENPLYERSVTGFTYIEGVLEYDYYLNPNGTDINIYVNEVDNSPISEALVSIKTFVNGSPVIVQSSFTDVRGYSRFILPVEKTYFVTVTKDNFKSVEDILINFNNPDISIVLRSTESQIIETGTEGIRYSLTPYNTLITNYSDVTFNYTIISSSNKLDKYTLSLYNGTSLISFVEAKNPAGSSLLINANLTPYINQTLRAVLTYKQLDEPEQVLQRLYQITDRDTYTGSLLELRDYMINSIDNTHRFILFVMAFFGSMFILSIFIKGFSNVLLSVLFSFIVGWLVGMSLFLLTSIGGILVLGLIAWSNEIR